MTKVTRLNTYEPRKDEVEKQFEEQVKKIGSHLTCHHEIFYCNILFFDLYIG